MHDTLSALVERALIDNYRPLEFYLREHSRLPGPRANLELMNDVSHLLAAAIPKYPDGVRSLINYFANGERKVVVSNTPGEFVMLCGVVAYGACAAVQPEWRVETFQLLSHYSCSPYWRVRECVATAYQHLVQADLQGTGVELTKLAESEKYLQQRAAVATLSEPRLLFDADSLKLALELHRIVLEKVHQVPSEDRKNEDFRVLRRGLGYTISVVTAAAPDEGFTLMRQWATWNDPDIVWILRENLKKKRLAKFIENTEDIFKLLA
ncbi:hypothetical protein [Tengunoibacter tsumagoiensis]|uniref:Uncharacterized protein n=1 Tax=Tengunoibacter tsumagoiensis TaxID=2014871 RepID=A0A401ZY69_9CHLR|nr:hypothetical protein [Tengunoibacter tsumagoiensis]GCE11785.1 hypothetical protein KTT_16440 [Tengunoibacter tsumagoiensis]